MLNLKHVVVRKTIPEKDRTKPMRNVAVLKKASEDSLLAEQITATPFDNRKLSCRRPSNFNWYAAGLGPRFSPDGTLLKHSLLGDPAIFYQTALAHGDIGLNVVPREIQLQLQTSVMEMQNLNVPIALSCIPEQTSPGSQPSNESHLTNNYSTLTNHPSCEKIDKKFLNREADYLQAKGDTASLENWKLKIGQQKLMQQKLSGLMKRKPNDLLMNSGENAYEIQLIREKLDRVIPLINDGKGSRYMSEFWNQPEYIRNTDSSDICTTLTMKERGIYRPIEFIKCPEVVKKEKGLLSSELNNNDVLKENITTSTSHNTYLMDRTQEVSDLLNYIVPYEPIMNDLAIIGQKILKDHSNESVIIQNTNKMLKETTHPEATQTIKSEKLTNTLVDSEVNETCVNEPSLYLNGYHLNWQSISSNPPQMSLDIHLTFENENPVLQTDYIELLNNGNVLISYEWTRIPQKNHFQIDTKESRVFYFDSKPGIIQPGDITHLPVTLKSSHEGIYKEIWRFDTTPTLQGMSPVYVHFHAISVWPEYHQFCSSLAKDIFIQLEREANYRMVYKMLENLIMNIQPKEHPPSPIPEPNTEEEIFTLSNPNFHYKHHVVQKLKQMYKEIKERENKIHGNNNDTMISNTDNWKYSIPELKKMIYKYPPDMTKPNAAVKREEEISKFYQSVDQLAFPSKSSFMNTSVERYRIGYTLLSQNIANLFDLCSNLRELHGLPELTSYPIKTQKMAKTLNLTNERIPASAVARNITQIKQSDEISMETDDKIPQIDLQLLLDDDQESNELVSFTKTIPPNSKLWKNKACSIVSVTISQLLNDLFTYWDDI
ncbi:MYCBP-associated protein isoform 1 [Schistosoma japonicum]|nr:MYCBP-associated protein isoform 1 [Schistosoma japonicum]